MTKIRKSTKVWTTKSGQKIRICDMTDQHLANTIAMLERKAPEALSQTSLAAMSFAASMHGEMASYYAEQDADRLLGMTPEEFLEEEFPLYEDLKNEQRRRNTV